MTNNRGGEGFASGLSHSNEILGDLVNKDTDLDGVLDWEESLWGTDPTKRDTNDDGVGDNIEVANLKKLAGQNENVDGSPSLSLEGEGGEENLTETDKFSREFFSTIATLNQTGSIDEDTVEKLSSSLVEHIQNSAPRKIFLFSDVKVIRDDSSQAIKNYDTAVENIRKKYPVNKSVTSVLQEFLVDENNVNVSALEELDPIIRQMTQIIDAIAKTNVPQTLSAMHLDLINGFQRLAENLEDIQLYDSDVIMALSAMSQYEKNVTALETTVNNLNNAINQKLNN